MFTTIEQIFEYSKSNESNINNLINDILKECVTPFVGAGLSAPAYPTWKQLLLEIAKSIDSPVNLSIFNDYIDQNQFENAADYLIEYLGDVAFYKSLRHIQGEDKLKSLGGSDYLIKQAVWILPQLFRRNIITTNYDRVIENVYACNNQILKVAVPQNRNIITKAIQGKIGCTLFKMHGDIESENNEIIFSKSSYDYYYGIERNNPNFMNSLVYDFSKMISSSKLLFLGCSLNDDRTLKVIKNVFAYSKSLEHYAIIDCEKVRLDEVKKKFHDDLGISCICFPTGRYECIKIILEYIRDRLNQNLTITPQLKFEDNINRFSFDTKKLEMYGREKELGELIDFCFQDINKPIWWTITGPGGIGKSKLAFELQNKLRQVGWKIVWIDNTNWNENIDNHLNLSNNLLIIIDEVQNYYKEIAIWFNKNYNNHNKIRFIFIDRNVNDFEKSNWGKLIVNESENSYFEDACFKKNFLKLDSISKESIRQLFINYAKINNKKIRSKTVDNLYNQLKIVDVKFERPLYALFIVDSWISKKDVLNWNSDQLLNKLISREIKLIKKSIKIFEPTASDKILMAILNISSVATIVGGFSLLKLNNYCKDSYQTLEKFVNEISSNSYEIYELLYKSSIDIKVENNSVFINPVKPDIVGELFVLKILTDTNLTQRRRILANLKESNVNITSFFEKLIIDFIDDIYLNRSLLLDLLEIFESDLRDPYTFEEWKDINIRLNNICDFGFFEIMIDRILSLINTHSERMYRNFADLLLSLCTTVENQVFILNIEKFNLIFQSLIKNNSILESEFINQLVILIYDINFNKKRKLKQIIGIFLNEDSNIVEKHNLYIIYMTAFYYEEAKCVDLKEVNRIDKEFLNYLNIDEFRFTFIKTLLNYKNFLNINEFRRIVNISLIVIDIYPSDLRTSAIFSKFLFSHLNMNMLTNLDNQIVEGLIKEICIKNTNDITTHLIQVKILNRKFNFENNIKNKFKILLEVDSIFSVFHEEYQIRTIYFDILNYYFRLNDDENNLFIIGRINQINENYPNDLYIKQHLIESEIKEYNSEVRGMRWIS